jgi:RNAse (barnase) inhibitor barstar
MNNRIIEFNCEQASLELEETLMNGNYRMITLNGKEIKERSSFFSIMEKELDFPEPCNNLFARFDDWITDLSWLPNDIGICIVIENSNDFLSSDLEFKDNLFEDFEEDILPYWEFEVSSVMKDGVPRNFYVVLK